MWPWTLQSRFLMKPLILRVIVTLRARTITSISKGSSSSVLLPNVRYIKLMKERNRNSWRNICFRSKLHNTSSVGKLPIWNGLDYHRALDLQSYIEKNRVCAFAWYYLTPVEGLCIAAGLTILDAAGKGWGSGLLRMDLVLRRLWMKRLTDSFDSMYAHWVASKMHNTVIL